MRAAVDENLRLLIFDGRKFAWRVFCCCAVVQWECLNEENSKMIGY